jgi:hypothetical protein
MKTKLIFIGLAAGFLSSCGENDHPAASHPSKPPPQFDQTQFEEITPMLDGSAYASSIDSRLWYLRGNKAVRVTVSGDASQSVPRFSDITAVLDGSAYATAFGGGVWYLHAEYAERANEGTSVTDTDEQPKVSDKAFYALYLSEHKKRKEAQDIIDNPPDSSDDLPDDSDPYP